MEIPPIVGEWVTMYLKLSTLVVPFGVDDSENDGVGLEFVESVQLDVHVTPPSAQLWKCEGVVEVLSVVLALLRGTMEVEVELVEVFELDVLQVGEDLGVEAELIEVLELDVVQVGKVLGVASGSQTKKITAKR